MKFRVQSRNILQFPVWNYSCIFEKETTILASNVSQLATGLFKFKIIWPYVDLSFQFLYLYLFGSRQLQLARTTRQFEPHNPCITNIKISTTKDNKASFYDVFISTHCLFFCKLPLYKTYRVVSNEPLQNTVKRAMVETSNLSNSLIIVTKWYIFKLSLY